MAGLGEAAALSVSCLWTVGTMLFTWSARRIGPDATNLIRISIAVVLLALLTTLLHGAPYPTWASPAQLALLSLSGLLGLVFGDGCYFRSLALIGPRRSTLIAALAPAMTAVLGWSLLGETLAPRAIAGMALTLAGTAWVVAERTGSGAAISRPLAGILYGLGGAFGQAAGLVMAKGAMQGLDAISSAVARMSAAAAGVWLVAMIGGHARADAAKLGHPGVFPRILAAALVGPVLGVSLSLYAAAHTETAIAATLMALVPIFILPVVHFVEHERITVRAIGGAVLAVLGVALLVTRG